jgi:hypothetical protein
VIVGARGIHEIRIAPPVERARGDAGPQSVVAILTLVGDIAPFTSIPTVWLTKVEQPFTLHHDLLSTKGR